MKIKDIKNTWEQYKDLIKTLTAIFVVVIGGAATITTIVMKDMMRTVIAEEVVKLQPITDLTAAVSTLTATVEAATASVERLDATVVVLQGDVTDIHKHLAGID